MSGITCSMAQRVIKPRHSGACRRKNAKRVERLKVGPQGERSE
jgi:hypothetical protein